MNRFMLKQRYEIIEIYCESRDDFINFTEHILAHLNKPSLRILDKSGTPYTYRFKDYKNKKECAKRRKCARNSEGNKCLSFIYRTIQCLLATDYICLM